MTTTEPTRGRPDDRLTRQQWSVLAVLCGTVFLEGLDVSMMGVALPSMREDLGLSTSTLQWVVSGYVLGYGGLVLLGGRAADLLGRRRMFVTWLVVFVAFSGLGGLAANGWMLIVARFATGVAAGFLTPASLSIITTTFAEGARRNRALLVYGGAGAGGFSLGMVAGGLLASIGWRWVFFAPATLAAVLLVAAMRLLRPDETTTSRPGGFDLPGAAALTGSMLLLVLTVVRAPDVAGSTTVLSAAGSVALAVTFVAIERQAAAPLVRLGILRSAPLVRANVGAMLFVGSFVAFQFVLVLYLQELRQWSALETGLGLMIAGIDAVLAPLAAPWFVERFGTARVITAAMVIAAIAYGTFLPLGADWSYAMLVPGLLLIGVAFSLAYGPLTIAATDGVADAEQGLAGGLLNASVQFGAATILAVVTAVNVTVTGDDPSAAAVLDGYRAALLVPVAAVLLGLVVTATGLATTRRTRTGAADTVARAA